MTAVLGRVIHTLAARGEEAALGDRELLARFAEKNDQSAFAVLVQRYSGMVLGVCRRSLANIQDAEDACQATFLVLAQKAAADHWRPSLANWLYTTARQVAANARIAAQRRAHRESQAALPERVGPLELVMGRELLAALYKELDRLHARYREPLVLCYLQGLTREEAAVCLGIPPGTLKTRLERGRQRLHDALTRCGWTLGASLLASMAVSPTRAASPGLVQAILATVGGSPPGLVVELARGVMMNTCVSRLFRRALGVAALALLGIGVWAAWPAALSQLPAKAEQLKAEGPVVKPDRADARQKTKSPAVDEKGNSVEVSGRVVDPDGKPVSGAKVFFARSVLAFFRDPPPPPPASVSTDAKGRFRFRVSKTGYLFAEEKAEWLEGGLVGVAPGYGPGWAYGEGAEKLVDVTIKLVKDVPIKGRVLDLEGKPVAGVSVRVRGYYLAEGDLKKWVEALQARKEGHDVHSLGGSMNPAYQLGLARPVITGADGAFRLTGVGAERVIALRFEGPTIAISEVYVVTRPCPTVVVPRNKKKPGAGNYVYHGPTFDHVVAPTMPIVGTIRAKDTGKPLAGVTVRAHLDSAYGYYNDRENFIRATTDKEGQYRLVGLPRMAGQYLWVAPAAGQPYLPPERATAGVSTGNDPLRVDFELKRGVLIRGRVTDKVTAQPVAALVEYMAFADNPHLKEGGVLRGYAFQVRTDPDGFFTLAGLPGRGLLAARVAYMEWHNRNGRYLLDVGADKIKGPIVTHGPWPARQFNTVVEISPTQEGGSVRQDIALIPVKKVPAGDKNSK
jgi:RNA polymerase sigma factor (sigma-70 family)